MKLWYKKNKMAMHDICLTKQEGPKGAHEEVLAGQIIEFPTDTSDEKLNVELEEEKATKSHESNPHEGNTKKESYKDLHDPKEQHVQQSNKEEPITKVAIYHQPP